MRDFLIGLGIGAGAAYLLTSRRGEQARKKIARSARSAARAAEKAVADPAAAVAELERHGRQVVEEFSHAMEPFRQRVQQAAEKAISTIASAAERLNKASFDELIAVKGIGPVMAHKIIGGRPYRSVTELVERGILPRSAFEAVRSGLLKQSA